MNARSEDAICRNQEAKMHARSEDAICENKHGRTQGGQEGELAPPEKSKKLKKYA